MFENIRFRTIWSLTAPLIIAQSVILVNGIVDLVIIGPIGTGAVAAASISNAICAVLFNFLEGFRTGTTVLVSGSTGNESRIRDVVRTAFVLCAVTGAVIAVASPFIADAVFAPNATGEDSLRANEYLLIWLCSVPVVLLMNVVTGLFRGLGNTVIPAIVSVGVCVLNAGISYLLVWGGFGVRGLGMTGSAWGTLIAEIIGLAALLLIAMRTKKTSRYIGVAGKQLHVREFVSLAANVGCNSGFTLAAFLIFVFMLRSLGDKALAVHQITLQVFNVAYMPAMGFLVAATIIIPRYNAAGRGEMVVKAARRISLMSFATIAVFCAAILISARTIGSFLSPADAAVAESAVHTIRLVCVGELFSSVYMVMRGVLIGCGDSRFILYEGLVSGYVIFLPLGYLLADIAGFGVYGGYCAFIVWCAVDCLALLVRFRCKR